MCQKIVAVQENSVVRIKNCHRNGYIHVRQDAVRSYRQQKVSMVYKDVEKAKVEAPGRTNTQPWIK